MPTIHHFQGWSFSQQCRGQWTLLRLSDGFKSWHQSYQGCKSFIRLHGAAVDPDQSYELNCSTLTHA